MNIDFNDVNSFVLSKYNYERIDDKDFIIAGYSVHSVDFFGCLEQIEKIYGSEGFVIVNNFNEILKKQIVKIQNYYNISYNLAKIIYTFCETYYLKGFDNIKINNSDEFVVVSSYDTGYRIYSCDYVDLFEQLFNLSFIYDKDGNSYDIKIEKFSLIKDR